jgi:hypothetical protein
MDSTASDIQMERCGIQRDGGEDMAEQDRRVTTRGEPQRGEGLVAIPWQEEPREVVREAAPLRGMGEEVIEARGVLFQRAGCGWAGDTTGHDATSCLCLPCRAPL